MRVSQDIQSAFIQSLKDRLPAHLSLVDELADLLNLSADSAYRRMRGDTPLTLQEAFLLAVHFNVSLDALMGQDSGIVPFIYQPIDEHNFRFRDYLKNVLDIMEFVDRHKDSDVVYLANDIPLFHLMHIPEIAAFKLFFWEKTILNYSSLADVQFEIGVADEFVNEISRKIRNIYCRIPSTEVYSSESIDATLKQIEYCFVAGMFKNEEDAGTLCDLLKNLMAHIRKMAEYGYKFKYDRDGNLPVEIMENSFVPNYMLYFNEVVHTDNTVLIKSGDEQRTYLTNNGINSFFTRSKRFYDDTYRSVDILLKKATLISGTSEKERNRIFNAYNRKIDNLRKLVSTG
ncbi:MAG: hypothetical protein H6606_09595 [Flavobacteriales bacterium]|nr:hypothetical protein [Flavobacteriales bacterium]